MQQERGERDQNECDRQGEENRLFSVSNDNREGGGLFKSCRTKGPLGMAYPVGQEDPEQSG